MCEMGFANRAEEDGNGADIHSMGLLPDLGRKN
jgi:hypothetical protein